MPDLNCTKFEARLMQAVEDRQSLGEDSDSLSAIWRELRAQAHACAHCRELWNEFALLESVFPIWKEHTPTVNLTDAVMARWKEEQCSSGKLSAPTHAKTSRRTIFALAAAVAVAVLACLPMLFPSRSEEGLPPTVPVVTTDPPTSPNLPEELKNHQPAIPQPNPAVPETDWQTLAQDAGSAYWSLASNTADSFASAKVLVPPRRPSARPVPPQETKPASHWAEGIGTGLQPIGQDVSRAMGFLFDVIPGDNPTI